jgi:hypothetical protein
MAIRPGIMVMRLIMAMGTDSAIGHTVITVTDLIIIISGTAIAGEEATIGVAIMAVGAVAVATGVGEEAGVAGKTSYADWAIKAT